MSDEHYQRVHAIFVKMLTDQQMEAMNPEATMDDVDGWDSMSFLEMIMGIEDDYGIRIDGLDATNLTSIPNILDYLQNKT